MKETHSITKLDLDYFEALNNLQVGVIVFHGKSINEIIPIYCNEKFLSLSGFNSDEYQKVISKGAFYGVHPDDLDLARQKFIEAFKTKKPVNHILRVKDGKTGEYQWVSMCGTTKTNEDGSFYVYFSFTNAKEIVYSQNVLKTRYKNLIVKSKQVQPGLLSSLHFNLTKDISTVIYNKLDTKFSIDFTKPFAESFYDATKNIPDEKLKKEFEAQFCKESLLDAFNNGNLNFEMEVPIMLTTDQIIWCDQVVRLSRNPETYDLECIMMLIENDKGIRLQNSFNTITKNDYEIVANLNLRTGLVRIINSRDDYGLTFENSTFYHQNIYENRLNHLIDEEFYEAADKALALKTVIQELKTKDNYVVTFPAKRGLLDHDSAFQWRFSYIDDSKEEVVFTRSEVIGFLDNRVKANTELSEAQQKAIEIGQNAKEGIAKRNTILIADDSDINREMLAIIFEDKFKILEAADGEAAIHLIDKNYENLALILLDMQMPKKTGLDVLIHLKMRNLHNSIPAMLVTGATSKELGLRSLEYGISDIINKPFDAKIVKRRALNLIELYAHKEEVEKQLEEWKKDAIQMHEQAEKNDELLIDVLSSVVEFRSIESGTHIKRVRKLTEIMLKTWVMIEPDVNITDSEIAQIARASTLHDIGKVAIPDNILLKPGKLTPEEFDIMKTHTTLGCKFLEQIQTDESGDFYKYCYDICRYHHERADGRGYPDGLKGDEIPFWAQIVSIADVYDALISPRVYKAAFTSEKAIDMIRNGECGNFSERLLACFEKAKDAIVSESAKMATEESSV